MNCPVCGKKLVEQKEGYLICPAGHGALVDAKYLRSQKMKPLAEDEINQLELPAQRMSNIICPHCQHWMQKSNYNDSGIIIDACTNCEYRWLDTDEVKRVKKLKLHTNPNELLFVDEINQKLSKTSGQKDQLVAPSTPNIEVERIDRRIKISWSTRILIGMVAAAAILITHYIIRNF